jgi:competence protein ComEC
MRGAIFYTGGIAFTSGIFLRSFFDIGGAGITLVLLVGIGCLLAWRITGHLQNSPLLVFGFVCCLLALGAARLHMPESQPSPLAAYEGVTTTLTGRIVREPEMREKVVHLYVVPDIEPKTRERILVTIDRFVYAKNPLVYGDMLSLEGELQKPEAFEADGGRVFDYPGYLKARGVQYTMRYASVTKVGHDERALVGMLYTQKEVFQKALRSIVPEPQSSLGEGVLLGVKRALPESLETTFRETGIIHIVVLSGYNVMIVVEALMYMLAFFFFPRTRMLMGTCAIVLFALFVGLSATVVRASIMAILLLIARGTGRVYAVLRALMLAAVGMLVVNPYLLVHDPGFQLSFLATLGLLLLSPPIEQRLSRVPQLLGMRSFVTATLATQVFVLPLLLYHTGTFSMVSVPVNVLVLPMVPVAMLATFLAGLAGIVSHTFGMAIGFFAHLALGYIIRVAELFGALPFAAFSMDAFPFWVVVLAYAALAYLIWRIRGGSLKKDDPVVNAYAGWTIEEEKEISPEARSASGESKSPLPFR